ncbi:MAG: serine/threonine-protein kinase [Planctomycetota bacterium]
MTSSFQRLHDLFERARGMPAEQREAFVRTAAAGDAELATRVMTLLRAGVPDGGGGVQSTETELLLQKLQKAPKLDAERYVLEGEIDRGGMGAVLRIHDAHLNRRLAMKVMLERGAAKDAEDARLSRQLLGRFLEEAQVTSQLDHPGVVPVHELGLDASGKVFFTMRLVKGRNASEVFALARTGDDGWTRTRALEVVLKVCDTMAYAHEKGVLHRDLKPGNVMVGRFGEVYVMDWGLAKVLGQEDKHDLRIVGSAALPRSAVDTARRHDAGSDEGSPVMTMGGQKLGTPSYMSPEQARSEALDVRADVYSIGAMLYELLAGRAPYTAPGQLRRAYDVLEDVVDKAPKRIEEIVHGVPAELIAVVDKAMARERDGRYASVQELAADLRAFLDQRVVKAYRTGALVEMRLWMWRNRALASSLGAAVLILVAGIVGTASYAYRADALAQEKTELASAESKAKDDALRERKRADDKAAELEWSTYVGNVQIAETYLALDDQARMQERLAACPERLRGWEWHWLSGQRDRVFVQLQGCGWPVRSASFSPDGLRVATGVGDGLQIWDTFDGERLWEVSGSDVSDSIAFSPDGRRLVTVGLATARLWDASNGAKLAELRGHAGLITGAAFSPDGARVVTSSTDQTARVWDATTGASMVELRGHGGSVSSAAFSPDGARVVTASSDCTARVWDVASGLSVVEVLTDSAVRFAVFNSDGRAIHTGHQSGQLQSWDALSGTKLGATSIEPRTDWNDVGEPGLSLVPSGPLLGVRGSATSDDRTSFLAQSGAEPLGALRPENRPPEDGEWRLSPSPTVRIYRMARDGCRTQLPVHAVVIAAAFTDDGSRVVAACLDHTVLVWDARSGVKLWEARGPRQFVKAVGLSADGLRVVTVSIENEVRVLDSMNGATLSLLGNGGASVQSVTISSDGGRVVTTSVDGTAAVWDASMAACLAQLEGHERAVESASFSRDGTRVVTTSLDKTVRIWDTASGACLAMLTGHAGFVKAASFSGDGARVVTASDDGTARVWDARSGLCLAEMKGHSAAVNAASMSPDGRRVVTAADDTTARVWDAATGASLAELKEQGSRALAASFSPDGKSILTAAGREIRIRHSEPYGARYPLIQEGRAALRLMRHRVHSRLEGGEDSLAVRKSVLSDATLTPAQRTAGQIAVQEWLDARKGAKK